MKKQDLLNLARLELANAGVGRGESLVLAISGGPDSMALVDIFRQLQLDIDWRLIVVHVNHNLRKTAKRDVELVSDYCRKYHLDCAIENIKLPIKSKQDMSRVEETARELRYKSLRRIARREHASWIITAHNADDQVETIIFNFLRGSSVRGLGGMRAVSEDIIRPFLGVSKAILLSYVKRYRVPFAVDETNRQLRFTRNRIRHKLLPILRGYNPGLDALILRNSRLFQQADLLIKDLARHQLTLIGRQSDGKVNISISKLSELMPLLQAEVIRSAVEQVAGDVYNWKGIHYQEITRLIAGRQARGSKRLPGKLVVEKAYDKITISRSG